MTTASHAAAPTQPPGQPSARRRNPRGAGGRLRDDIIAAATQLLAETGDDSQLTLRGVAKRLGIAAPSIYRHFPDIGHLKLAVVERSFATFTQARDAAAAQHTADPAQALLARCRAYCDFALANPGPYRFLFSHHAPTGDPGGPLVGLPAFDALAASIRRCQQAGLAGASDDPAWLAAQVWAALHGLVLLRMNAPGFPWPAPIEQLADQAVARLIQLQLQPDPPAPDRPNGHPAPANDPSRQGGPT
jgi:AcrR family transcriptional regulator